MYGDIMDKKRNKLKENLIEKTIGLRKFLILYYGINVDAHGNKLTHNDVSNLFSNIKRLDSNDILKYKTEIFSGDVICVYDSFNEIALYIRPDIKNFDSIDTVFAEEEKTDKLEDVILSSDLSTYELSLLCKKYKNSNRIKEYRTAYRILKNKKEKNKIKKNSKINISFREDEYYD